MIYIILNAVAIISAGAAGLIIARLWYPKRTTVAAFVVLLLCNLWLASILAGALILAPPTGNVWTMTIGSAVVIWAGFVAPAIVGSYRLRNVRAGAVLTDCGYWLITMVAQSILMRLIGLTAPPAA